MGYLWPQQGSVSVLGRRYGRTCLPELRRGIGYVSTWIFERTRGHYTVKGIVASGLDASICHRGQYDPQTHKKVCDILDSFSCLDLLEKTFNELSSGEQFKVILCRALINRPALLILDEPFALLDIGSRQKAYLVLEHIARGVSAPQIILVTHHLEDIRPFFTHGVIMQKGQIIKKGKKNAVLTGKTFKQVFDLENYTLSN